MVNGLSCVQLYMACTIHDILTHEILNVHHYDLFHGEIVQFVIIHRLLVRIETQKCCGNSANRKLLVQALQNI